MPFLGHAVVDDLEVVGELRAVDPVVVGQVGADEAAEVLAVAGGAQLVEDALAVGQAGGVVQGLHGGHVLFELGQRPSP